VGCGPLATRSPGPDETAIDRAPFLIDKPGKYILVKDIAAEASAIGLVSDNVTLDLNGHTITYGTGVKNVAKSVITYNSRKTGNVGHSGILLPGRPDITEDFPGFMWNSRRRGIAIRNGRIVEGAGEGLAYTVGLQLGGAMGAQVENLSVEVAAPDAFGVELGPECKLSRTTVIHKGTHVTNRHAQVADIQMAPGGEVCRCLLEGGPQAGIKAATGASIHDNLIRHRATATNGYGVMGYGQKAVKVFSNRIMAYNGRGIHLSEKSEGWDVHDNYVEVRETRNQEYNKLQTHGIKLEGTRNSRVCRNTVLAVSSEGGEPTPLNLSIAPDSGNEVFGNTFVALTINRESACGVYLVGADGRGTSINDNSIYTNNIAFMVSPDGGGSVTLRRCRFRKIAPQDRVTFYADRNYRKAEGGGNRFVDCLFLDGIDPRAFSFPPKGADWRSPGGYAVGWSLALAVSDGPQPAAGATVVAIDKDGKEAARAAADAGGRASVDLLEFSVDYRKETAVATVTEGGPYTVRVSAGGKSREFKVTPKSPMAADVDVAATGEISAKPVALATDDAGAATPAGARPFWRERVAEFLKQKVPGQAGARE
jgi:hypothetical protein